MVVKSKGPSGRWNRHGVSRRGVVFRFTMVAIVPAQWGEKAGHVTQRCRLQGSDWKQDGHQYLHKYTRILGTSFTWAPAQPKIIGVELGKHILDQKGCLITFRAMAQASWGFRRAQSSNCFTGTISLSPLHYQGTVWM